MEKLEFADPKDEKAESPPEPEKPEGQSEYKTKGETVKIIIQDACGDSRPVVLTHPDYPLGEKVVVIKRREPVDVDSRVLEQLDQPYRTEYFQDTNADGHKFGPLKRVEVKLYPYHIIG